MKSIVNRKQLSDEFIDFLFTFHKNFFHQMTFPVPANHFMTLVSLSDHGTLTITTLSEQLAISKQQMTPIIDKLSKNGYVERHTDSRDRRCTNVTLTEKGTKLLSVQDSVTKMLFEKRINLLSNTEITSFDQSLKVLAPLFKKMF